MSLNEKQIEFLGCACDVLQIQRPEFDDLTGEQHQALLDCFNTLVKPKKSKATKEKSDASDTFKKPGNVWISWLKLNRDALKTKNGGEDGLTAILTQKYKDFKKTSAYGDLQNECAERMREYKEKSDASEDSDDEKPKKKTKAKAKAKKVEKSPEEKKPLNVYMAFLREHLDEIKANLGGKSFNEAKKEAYAAFQKTPAFKTLEAKCKNELKVWNETVPKKVKVAADSDSEDEVKPVKKSKRVVVESVSSEEVAVEAPKEKTKKKSKKESKKVVESSDEDELPVPEKPKKAKKDKKKAKKDSLSSDDDAPDAIDETPKKVKKQASVDAPKKQAKKNQVSSDDEAPDAIENQDDDEAPDA